MKNNKKPKGESGEQKTQRLYALPFMSYAINNQRGQFSFLFILSLASFLLIASIAVDGGRLYFLWSGVSRALDASCSSIIRKVGTLSDSEIQQAAEAITRYNLQSQGFSAQNVSVNTSVIRNAAFSGLSKVSITGTVSNIASALLSLAPGENSSITVKCTAPTCYNNPTSFMIPVTGYYDGGLQCQLACNDGNYKIPGTNSCCPFIHGNSSCQLGQATCTCASTTELAVNTDYCDVNANPAGPINAADPGISGPIWIDRTNEDPLQDACTFECGRRGLPKGVLWCNEACQAETGTVCCKCHCTN